MSGDGEPAFIDRPDLVHRTLSAGCLTPTVERDGIYALRAGSQKTLAQSTLDIHQTVRRTCKFGDERSWRRGYALIECVVSQFFGDDEGAFGLYEVVKHRRRAKSRSRAAAALFKESPPLPSYLASERDLRHSAVTLDGLEIPPGLLRFAYRDGVSRKGAELTELVIPRTFEGGGCRPWSEHWYSLARRDYDSEDLGSGVIPAQGPHLTDQGNVRLTPILSFLRFSPTWRGPDTLAELLALELHPDSGMVVSLRRSAQDLGSLMHMTLYGDSPVLEALGQA